MENAVKAVKNNKW